MMYRVTWAIDIDATSPLYAARLARFMQLASDSIATVFDVKGEDDTPYTIDLADHPEG